MSTALKIDKQLSDEQIYESLLPQITSLIVIDEPVISCLSNISAALKTSFPKISWIGFYLRKENNLYLGPFQGNVACTIIPMGKGVCGTSAMNKETIIVDDVNTFPGHIACDSNSRSEIVVPLIKGNELFGVLDLDSYDDSSFNLTDKFFLEKLCSEITKIFSATKLSNILN